MSYCSLNFRILKIKKVLISQPKPTSEKSPYYDIAEKYGIKIDFRPFIKVEGLSAKDFRQQKISILDYTAVLFTSRHSIDYFFTLCQELRIVIPETLKYFCVSETIALYIQKYTQYRKRKIFFGPTGKFKDLLPLILKHNSENYFIPISENHTDEIGTTLTANKISFKEGVMYRTVSNDFEKDESFDYDMLIFFTPSGISSLLKNFPDFEQNDIRIGCFGPQTAKAIRDAGLRLDLEAPTPTAPSITAALNLYMKENNK
jgi:uroporphyrinogen-III synthase